MSILLRLNDAARARLHAQLNLNGTFTHTLRNAVRASVQVTVRIEQGPDAINAIVRGIESVNSITLSKHDRCNPSRLARFIESSANGLTRCDDFLDDEAWEPWLAEASYDPRIAHAA